MNRRRRQNEYEAGKNSFSAPPPSPTRERRIVKNAIDDSLDHVRFNAQDARSVMQAVHSGRRKKTAKRRRALRPDLIFSFSLLLMIALPLSLYAVRSTSNVTTIAANAGQPSIQPQDSFDPIIETQSAAPTAVPAVPPKTESPLTPTAGSLISESEAIRLARECFIAHCDTSIFTFEEYEVSAVLSSEPAQYAVSLESIYNNGCSFTVVIDAQSSEILQYSSPKQATLPSSVSRETPEVRAWYEKHGEHLFTWPQDAQAEFSRRYQGGTLRTAREGELTSEQATSAAESYLAGKAPGQYTAFYPVLYSERAASNAKAFYVVYCFNDADEAARANDEPMTLSIDAATGDVITAEGRLQEQNR